jgi:hypothetical protein
VCPESSNKNPTSEELEAAIEEVRRRFAELPEGTCKKRIFYNRLKNLGRFDAEPVDYQNPEEVVLPREIEVGFAVCHPECGNQALLVVEGGPQACDCCGATMYPIEVAPYRLKKK